MILQVKLPTDDLGEAVRQMPAWDRFRGKRIFITGASGFMGRWLLESLCRANDQFALGVRIRVLLRRPEEWAASMPHMGGAPVEVIRGDVRDFAWDGAPIDWVVHGAAPVRSAALRAPALDVFDQIVSGTRRVLEVAEQAGATRFLLLSSGAVYGNEPMHPSGFCEDDSTGPDPLRADNVYGAGKRAAETLCALFAQRGQLEPVIARCFAFVGPLLPLEDRFAIGNFLSAASRGTSPCITGIGLNVRSYLYTTEMAAWLWALLALGTPGRAYNVGSPKPITLRDAAAVVAAAANLAPALSSASPGDAAATRYFPDVTRIAKELGLMQRVELTEAVRRTLLWIQTAS